MCVPGNCKLLAESVTSGLSDAVPLSATDCGLLGALSEIVTAPVRVPVAVGVKVTPSEHEAAGASEAGQVLVASAKSPLGRMLVMVRVAAPELVSVTVWAALVVPTD